MTLAELITQALDVAVAGSDPDSSVLRKLTLEAETLAALALQDLAVEVAGNPNLRARLEKQFSVALTAGVGALPAGLLVEYIREGSVRDGATNAPDGGGNSLQRIKYYNDFLGFLPTAFGYYCIVDNQIFTREIGTGDFTSTPSPLKLDAPFVPTKANLNTDVPDELADDLTEILALKLRGMIDGQRRNE